MDAELAPSPFRIESEIIPQAGRFNQHLGPLLVEEGLIPGNFDVLLQPVHDVRIDVILRRSCRVVRRRLLSVDSPPGKQCPLLIHLPSPLSGPVQHAVPELQQVLGDAWSRVHEKR